MAHGTGLIAAYFGDVMGQSIASINNLVLYLLVNPISPKYGGHKILRGKFKICILHLFLIVEMSSTAICKKVF